MLFSISKQLKFYVNNCHIINFDCNILFYPNSHSIHCTFYVFKHYIVYTAGRLKKNMTPWFETFIECAKAFTFQTENFKKNNDFLLEVKCASQWYTHWFQIEGALKKFKNWFFTTLFRSPLRNTFPQRNWAEIISGSNKSNFPRNSRVREFI